MYYVSSIPCPAARCISPMIAASRGFRLSQLPVTRRPSVTLECDRLNRRLQSCNFQPATLRALSAVPIPSPHSRELPEFSRAQLHVQLTREACSPCPILLTPLKLQGALEQPNLCSHGRPENRLIWDGPRKTACLFAGTGAAIVDDGPMAKLRGSSIPSCLGLSFSSLC